MKCQARDRDKPRPVGSNKVVADRPPYLYLVERSLPTITKRGLDLLQTALVEATHRFASRGRDIAYLGSAFLPMSGRLLSCFTAESPEVVKAVNEAAMAPFTTIDRAVALRESGVETEV